MKEISKSSLIPLLAVFLITSAVLLYISHMADHRASNALLRRYCDDPARHVALVKRILTKDEPAGTGTRRPYIIAAKLIYIVQQEVNEPVQTYLERLHTTIVASCN